MKELKRFFRLHIDIQTLVIILLIVTLFYRPLFNYFFTFLSTQKEPEIPAWFEAMGTKVVCEIAAAVIVVPIIFWMFRISTRSMLSGEFIAYDIDDAGKEKEFGTVKLSYNLFSNKIKGALTNEETRTYLDIDAVFDKGSYLRGHYIEKEKPNRRRMGAFLLVLDGEGDDYIGNYVFVDPMSGNDKPKEGKAKWIKINT